MSVDRLCSISQPAPDFNASIVCVRPMWAEAVTVHAGDARMMWQSTGAQGTALGLQQAMAAQAAQQQQQQGPRVQVRPCWRSPCASATVLSNTLLSCDASAWRTGLLISGNQKGCAR